MGNEDKVELFENTKISKAIVTLAVPTIISSLVMVIYNLADTFFVGMLNDPLQNAAVTLAAPILLAFNAINNLFGVGTSSLMSRSLGKRDYEAVKKSSATGFYCSLLFSILISLCYSIYSKDVLIILGTDANTINATADYLKWTVTFGAVPSILNVVMAYLVRSEGSSLHASIGTMSGCLLNIILDPIFILPQFLNMGAAGAGLATFISNCFACLYFFILIIIIKKDKTFVSFNPKIISLDKAIIFGIMAVGIPASIQNLLNVTGMTVLNNFASSYGADAIAAMGISQKINSVPFQVALGFSQGVMPLVGYNYASGNIKRMKETIMMSFKIVIVITLSVAVLYYFNASTLISLFMKNEIVIYYGASFLKAMCLCIPFIGTDFLGVGIFQSCGLGKNALVFAILRKIVFEIPGLFILNYLFPLYGLPYAQVISEVVLAIAAIITVNKIIKKAENSVNLQH